MNLNEISIKVEPKDICEDPQPQLTIDQEGPVKIEPPDDIAIRTQVKKDSAVFECPNCAIAMTSLNRLRLHICSYHDHINHNLQCPICSKRMQGYAYELHVLQDHYSLIEFDPYIFTPQVWCVKNEGEKKRGPTAPQFKAYSIEFNMKNPWKEILSATSRQKRSYDALKVAEIRRRLKMEPSSGEAADTKISWNSKTKQSRILQNKLNFISGLSLNSHYTEYLRHLKHLKLKKMLLTRFVSKMSDTQIERVKREIKRSEALLNRFAISDSKEFPPSSLQEAERELSFQENASDGLKEYKKIMKLLKSENQPLMLKNLSTKKGDTSVGEVDPGAESVPVVDLGGLNVTAISAPEDTEEIKIKREPVNSEEPVIALNIPVNEILGNSFVIENIKSEK